MSLYLGTSGYNYKHWKVNFYPSGLPQKNWLSFYAQNFNCIEINATFYRGFPKKVLENWTQKTPPDFSFVLKGPRLITHRYKLLNIESPLKFFLDSSTELGSKLSCFLWQFPKNFKYTPQNADKLKKFLKLLSKNNNAFELRDDSWFNNDVFQLISSHEATIVINNGGNFPVIDRVAGNFVYLRLHGPTSTYSSNYSDKFLKDLAKQIKTYLKKYDVYVFFNNDAEGFAIKNAQTLKSFLS